MRYVAVALLLAVSPARAAGILPLTTSDIDAVMGECDADVTALGARARLLAIRLSQADAEIAALRAELAKAVPADKPKDAPK